MPKSVAKRGLLRFGGDSQKRSPARSVHHKRIGQFSSRTEAGLHTESRGRYALHRRLSMSGPLVFACASLGMAKGSYSEYRDARVFRAFPDLLPFLEATCPLGRGRNEIENPERPRATACICRGRLKGAKSYGCTTARLPSRARRSKPGFLCPRRECCD